MILKDSMIQWFYDYVFNMTFLSIYLEDLNEKNQSGVIKKEIFFIKKYVFELIFPI